MLSLYKSLDILCDSILCIDRNVQSVAVLNNKGRVMEKISKPIFAEKFPDYLSEVFCMHHVLQISMGRDFDEKYGPINYHINERSNLTMIAFPLEDVVVLVTTNKDMGSITLAGKINLLLNEYRK